MVQTITILNYKRQSIRLSHNMKLKELENNSTSNWGIQVYDIN